MKIGLSTITFRHFPLERVLNEAKKHGFDYVDVAGIPGWAPHLDFKLMTENEVRSLREMLECLGLKIASFNVGSNLSNPNDSERSVEFVRAAIRVASKVEVPIITTGVGSSKGTRELSIRNIMKLSRFAEDNEVTFTLELPHLGTLAEKWTDTLFYLNAMPEVFLTLDTSHLHISRGKIMDLQPFVDRIKHIHLRDAKGSDISYVPGEGEFNFKEFFNLMKPRYRGAYVLELEILETCFDIIAQRVDDSKAFVAKVYESTIQ